MAPPGQPGSTALLDKDKWTVMFRWRPGPERSLPLQTQTPELKNTTGARDAGILIQIQNMCALNFMSSSHDSLRIVNIIKAYNFIKETLVGPSRYQP